MILSFVILLTRLHKQTSKKSSRVLLGKFNIFLKTPVYYIKEVFLHFAILWDSRAILYYLLTYLFGWSCGCFEHQPTDALKSSLLILIPDISNIKQTLRTMHCLEDPIMRHNGVGWGDATFILRGRKICVSFATLLTSL